jgi:tetratricopeptide (TPR) repeat protein
MRSQIQAKTPEAVIQTGERIPAATRQQLEARPDYWSEMAVAYYSAQQKPAGEQALRKALEMAASSDNADALNARLDVASMLMNRGETLRAIDIYRQASQANPENSGAWQGLVGAYVRMRDYSHAKVAVRSMPQHSYEAATKNSGFLSAVAAIYSAQGQCGEAEDFLNQSINLDQAAGRQPEESIQLQLADIWTREHNYQRAAQEYRQIVSKDENSAEAWRGYITALHEVRDDSTALTEARRMPQPVSAHLQKDAGFLTLLASAESATGQKEQVIRLLEQARSAYQLQGQPFPFELDVQLAWTMVDASQHEQDLQDLLTKTRSQSDLTTKQRATIDEIWSVWTIRRANQALTAKKPAQAIAILTDAQRDLPNDRRIPAAMAAVYLREHDWNKALDVYQSWKMAGAEAADYRSAAGAALSAHKSEVADHFLREGLLQFPDDPELLHMTAKQAVVHGNYKEGERYLKLALAASRKEETNPRQSKPQPSQDALQREDAVPLNANGAAAYPLRSSTDAPGCEVTAGSTPSDLSLRPISARYMSDANGPVHIEEVHQIQDEIDVVQNRNTPFLGAGDVVSGRTGDAGFDRLIIEDGATSDAFTIDNKVRIGVEAHGVYLFSGTPDGSSNFRLGSLAPGATFGEQTALGSTGEVQLSTNTFGLAFGVSPQGFLVENFTGGLRFRPADGPFTFMAVRDGVKDSILSYAGVRDPVTGLVWGGVISNSGSVQLKLDPSAKGQYARIGGYITASGGFLQGKNVPDNWEASGNAGFYGQIVKGLTLGLNVSGMHYDKNLQYFSLGQGGYFSPQVFGMGSIPITWFARHKRFEYQIRASGGVQYLSMDSSPFYPGPAGPGVPAQGFYSSSTHTGPAYDASLRLGYRIAPHAYFETFATANNARNYNTQSIGFSVKFLVHRLPTDTDLHPNSIPDWKGTQPFGIQ